MLGFIPPIPLAPPPRPVLQGPNPLDSLPLNPLDPWYWPPLPSLPFPSIPDLPDWLFPPPPPPAPELPDAPLPRSPYPEPIPDPVPGVNYTFPPNPAAPTTDVRWDIEYTIRDQQFPLLSCVSGDPDPDVDETFTYNEYVTGTSLKIKIRQGRLISDGCNASYQGFSPDNVSRPAIEAEYLYSDGVWREAFQRSSVGENHYGRIVTEGVSQITTTTLTKVERLDIEIPLPDPVPDPEPKKRPLVIPEILPETAPEVVPLPLPLPEPLPFPEVEPFREPAPDPDIKPAPGPRPQPVPVPSPVPGPVPIPDIDTDPEPDVIPTPPEINPEFVPGTAPDPALLPEGAVPLVPGLPFKPPTSDIVPVTPKDNRYYPGNKKPITTGGASTNPQQIANEIARIEDKSRTNMERLNDALGILDLIIDAIGDGPLPAAEYTLHGICEKVAEPGDPQPEVTWFIPQEKALLGLGQRVDAIAEMLQIQLGWKTPICSPTPSPPVGHLVSIHFESAESSPNGDRRLRKLFRYRSQSTRTLAEIAAYWKGFEWQAGPFVVGHTASDWGTVQVWAASVAEGQRVIRQAGTEAGVDPDNSGQWRTGSSDDPRYGMPGTMRIQKLEDGDWITSRRGPSGLPLYTVDP